MYTDDKVGWQLVNTLGFNDSESPIDMFVSNLFRLEIEPWAVLDEKFSSFFSVVTKVKKFCLFTNLISKKFFV